MLGRFTQGESFRATDSVHVRMHEMPFVCDWQGRTIDGSMDALVQTANGAWFVADLEMPCIAQTQACTQLLSPRGLMIRAARHGGNLHDR